MANFGSWRFWIIIALALTTLACAGRAERRERREQAREDRRERNEQRRAERQEQLERRRSQRDAPSEAVAEPAPPAQQRQAAAAASFTPVAAPMSAAAAGADSKVIFMRVSKQSAGVNAALFDVTEPGEPKYIGTVNSASKIAYPVAPGLYTFMVVGETAEFLQATVIGGRTYYALVIPRSNAKRFTLEPVRQNEIGGKEFQSWDRSTRMTSNAAQPYNAGDAADKRQRYWPEWSRKPESQRAELTLHAEDGR